MHHDPNPTATSVAATAVADHHPAEAAVRRALAEHGRLTVDARAVDTDADLYALGLTSHATVNVMLAIENDLDVEFPDAVLHRATFATIESITTAAEAAA